MNTAPDSPIDPEEVEDMPELLTVKEAARAARVHEQTIRRLIHEKALPSVRVGSQLRVPRSALEPKKEDTDE